MSHLTLEALARLLDEPPTDAERAHLGDCAVCRDELTGLRGQTDALAALPNMVPPPDVWPEVRERLMAERLVRTAPSRRVAGPLRSAAAILLFIGGGALGWAVRGDAATPAQGPSLAAEEPAGRTGPRSADPVAPGRPALSEVEAAQQAFLSALDEYMAATGTSPSDPATRLAALDHIVLTTAEALNEAPADPVINSFHLTALAQRNAMLREIQTSADPVF